MIKMLFARQRSAPAVALAANDDDKRDQQENFKVRGDCRLAIAALSRAYGMSKAELLEHMVAKELEAAKKAGARLEFKAR